MGCVVFDKPEIEHLTVGKKYHLFSLKKGFQFFLQFPQVVKWYAREIVVFQVICRKQIEKIPYPIGSHEGCPVGDFIWIYHIVLPQPVDSKSNGKDKKYRKKMRFKSKPRVQRPEPRQDSQVQDDSQRAFSFDLAAELLWITFEGFGYCPKINGE